MLARRLSKSERTRRELQRVKAGNGPGEKGTIDVKGEYGRASSTVGGRNGRPLPFAVCQSPLGYADMAAVDCLCAGGGLAKTAQAVRSEACCGGSRGRCKQGADSTFRSAWLSRSGSVLMLLFKGRVARSAALSDASSRKPVIAAHARCFGTSANGAERPR